MLLLLPKYRQGSQGSYSHGLAVAELDLEPIPPSSPFTTPGRTGTAAGADGQEEAITGKGAKNLVKEHMHSARGCRRPATLQRGSQRGLR